MFGQRLGLISGMFSKLNDAMKIATSLVLVCLFGPEGVSPSFSSTFFCIYIYLECNHLNAAWEVLFGEKQVIASYVFNKNVVLLPNCSNTLLLE